MISFLSGFRIGTPRLLTHGLAHVSANVLCVDEVLSGRHCRPGVPTVVYTSPSLCTLLRGIRSQCCPHLISQKRSVLCDECCSGTPDPPICCVCCDLRRRDPRYFGIRSDSIGLLNLSRRTYRAVHPSSGLSNIELWQVTCTRACAEVFGRIISCLATFICSTFGSSDAFPWLWK